MGDYDLVTENLERAGVRIFFDRVSIKPGRPMTFGKKGETLVFALPGNTVSAIVTFHVFVAPAIMKMRGMSIEKGAGLEAVVEARGRDKKGERMEFRPAVTSVRKGTFYMREVSSLGSADLISCTKANSLMVVPSDKKKIKEGDFLRFMPRRDFFYR